MLHYLDTALAAPRPSRRAFLKLSAGAVGGLLLGGALPRAAQAMGDDALAQPFVHITPDNVVTVLVKHQDMGQGAATGLATLVAEELDASPDQIAVEFAPSNPQVYANSLFGVQGTGGSTAMRNSFTQYREAGASARAMLVAAAAQAWGVAPEAVTVADGTLSSGANSASFGDMASAAAAQPVPEAVTLKRADQWRLIGKDMARVEIPAKTRGSVGLFGMDAKPEGALIAVTARPPRFGATVASVDAEAARAMPGVQAVLTIPQGVVVVADNTWRAMQARDALEIEWDMSGAETRGTEEITAEFEALLDQPGLPAVARGDAAGKLAGAAQVVEARYHFPYLAHAPMEPLNMTVLFDGERATLWGGSQIQTIDHNVAAGVLGIPFENVAINTMWGGGSFGRRATADGHLVAEAATIAAAWLGETGRPAPIKLVYTREDDIKGGYYRPLTLHKVRAGVDAEGNIAGWAHRVVGQGIMIGTPFEEFLVKDGVDHSSVEGAADTTYSLPDMAMDVHHPSAGVPVLWWRAVGHTHTAYVMETMMDALAEAAGRDPVEFRLAHLGDDPRLAGVLRLAAEKGGWDSPAPEGIHRGVAVHKSFESYVAEVAEVRIREDGTVKVEKVTCAVDCGVAINPDNIVAQIEGGLAYGLSGILREEITMTDGAVDQSNYPDYAALRIADMPRVEVHIVPSTEGPSGVGEPGTPPIGPAVANAVARATGQRITVLPFSKHGLA
ncbi:aldehyde oxidase and xanthine dehydrogenase molybdopterin binding [Dinoroseobacter shibae DFL 12 = DSM 16493]|jgi:isoquinoline 1-oxidoreductase beta subunit|uniref:Aldehyde oxidase and xanthine dehydrogenase molybdopterin binding n=1 Tax=Dinoroseobacter shibae (strain DSM 16493 / NCIMB 14021 / DFL 12) TaxID=398580 RepID=A8LRG0_DINSH|nr:xanthine dehydrogenase family protein molybdopterin-binding subunit [Dinoroseobacter shibae]ABV92610.1 aldehyde oxidase and xanthine dehydrogenase molybdopterin binding [Dinoroseobacter shibae DFL 12 = DSM 16493]URF47552.1 xanthine dehydrogenase family protein molybdopterin-binding subunit [Dinoroseobacter shibae]URF51862.1 xanthine dehydrogenase family protein molybdopterin-binding subunit [Dinoroseobacter shibae]